MKKYMDRFLKALLDLFASCSMLTYLVLITPIIFLLKQLHPKKINYLLKVLWVLPSKGLLSQWIQIQIERFSLNRNDHIVQLEVLIACLEPCEKETISFASLSILKSLYVELVQCYLKKGQLADGLNTLMRFFKRHKVTLIPEFENIDQKTAHFLRAAINASKLFDEESFTALFMKASTPKSPTATTVGGTSTTNSPFPSKPKLVVPNQENKSVANTPVNPLQKNKKEKKETKILPFPGTNK